MKKKIEEFTFFWHEFKLRYKSPSQTVPNIKGVWTEVIKVMSQEMFQLELP